MHLGTKTRRRSVSQFRPNLPFSYEKIDLGSQHRRCGNSRDHSQRIASGTCVVMPITHIHQSGIPCPPKLASVGGLAAILGSRAQEWALLCFFASSSTHWSVVTKLLFQMDRTQRLRAP